MKPNNKRVFNTRLSAVLGLVFGLILSGIVLAAPASAHHPVVNGSWVCDTATGKFDLTFTVESDADYNKDWSLTAVATTPAGLSLSWNRPPGTDTDDQNDFVATVQDVTAGDYTLNVTARWHTKGNPNGGVATQTGAKTLKPSGDCNKTTTVPAQPASKDDCNPPNVTNNVVWVPESGPADTTEVNWTMNPNGSLTATPQPGHQFQGQQQSYTFYLPPDSGATCDMPPPAFLGYKSYLQTSCITSNYGEYSARVKALRKNTQVLRNIVIKKNKVTVAKRAKLRAGQVFRHSDTVAVGSLIRVFVGGDLVERRRVPAGCPPPPDHDGGLRQARAAGG